MEIAEIRDLDGPNLFMLRPAIKVEIDCGAGEPHVAERLIAELVGRGELTVPDRAELVPVSQERLVALLGQTVGALHAIAGTTPPEIVSRRLEAPGHVAIAFAWTHRTFARLVARTAFDVVSGSLGMLPAHLELLGTYAFDGLPEGDGPEMLADAHRTIPIIAVTGTNGKTTTTRMISSILMRSGKRVGWTSSAGVVIQGEMVLEGDYTGPAGARRVYDEPGLDIAVLETARGGILLRGLGYEANDVSVVTNVSADHLGLHGVYSVEELARVKSVVAAVTRADGYAVLNADDPLVLEMRGRLRARPFLISRDSRNEAVRELRETGGRALWIDDSTVWMARDGIEQVLTTVADIPIAFGGRAPHMLENALCAAAACLAIGLTPEEVQDGLAHFRNQAKQNRGRLNIYDLDGVTVVVDFAHNVEGLRHLLKLGRGFVAGEGRVIAVIGTAGDRPDDTFLDMGKLAGDQAEIVIMKDTTRYLRGRPPGESVSLIQKGLNQTSCQHSEVAHGEFEAVERALSLAAPGDSVVIMCVEEVDRVLDHLEDIGTPVS